MFRCAAERPLNLRSPPKRGGLLPIAVFAFGWALMVPVVTLMVLDLAPDRRGMASSLQAFIGAGATASLPVSSRRW